MVAGCFRAYRLCLVGLSYGKDCDELGFAPDRSGSRVKLVPIFKSGHTGNLRDAECFVGGAEKEPATLSGAVFLDGFRASCAYRLLGESTGDLRVAWTRRGN